MIVLQRRTLAWFVGIVLLAACGGSGAEETGEPGDTSTTNGVVVSVTTGAETSPGGEPLLPEDPCQVLTLEDVQAEFPENTQVVSSDEDGCLWDTIRIDFKPLTLEIIEGEADPTGWDPRPIDVPGAEWAVVRIDTNVTEFERVFDVFAGGPAGTVHLIPWAERDDMELNSPEYDSLLELLRVAWDRLSQ